ncbi:uncharacterized protein LOC127742404 isoform X2 [Arachis duranensis]|uniref:Uncharacterized protein LOC127742404 isoform X2 n=1 Tax=Arachis duranensis TaxID=130453 RepID=A0A9C6WM10_ARADU|nr:uncharacterized protein LOC127742404 isoform X2 [Arachis duranensis]
MLLDESQVRSIVDEIKQVITASSSRKRERAERTKVKDFDAEESELIKEENEQEGEVFDQVSCLNSFLKNPSYVDCWATVFVLCLYRSILWSSFQNIYVSQVGEILGTLIKTFKASFLPFFDELSSYLTPMWVIPGWLNYLPIKGDLIEAKVVHDQLCSMVERLIKHQGKETVREHQPLV